jgi:hypothetical protein
VNAAGNTAAFGNEGRFLIRDEDWTGSQSLTSVMEARANIIGQACFY